MRCWEREELDMLLRATASATPSTLVRTITASRRVRPTRLVAVAQLSDNTDKT